MLGIRLTRILRTQLLHIEFDSQPLFVFIVLGRARARACVCAAGNAPHNSIHDDVWVSMNDIRRIAVHTHREVSQSGANSASKRIDESRNNQKPPFVVCSQ